MSKDMKALVEASVNGYRLAPLHFLSTEGRKLASIIDESGKVYRPHVYDVPGEPFKVLAFSLNHVLTMIDMGLVPVGSRGLFITERELTDYREKTLDFLRALECPVIGAGIEYQKEEEVEKCHL